MTSLALFALPLSRPRALFPLQNGSTLAQVAAHHGHAEVLKVLYELTQLETLTKESVPTTGATHALAQKRTHRKAAQMIVLLFLWQARRTHGSVLRQVPNNPLQAPVSALTH